MRRRELITLFGGAAAASMLWPPPLAAQQPKLPRIDVLVTANPEPFWSEFRVACASMATARDKTFSSSSARPTAR